MSWFPFQLLVLREALNSPLSPEESAQPNQVQFDHKILVQSDMREGRVVERIPPQPQSGTLFYSINLFIGHKIDSVCLPPSARLGWPPLNIHIPQSATISDGLRTGDYLNKLHHPIKWETDTNTLKIKQGIYKYRRRNIRYFETSTEITSIVCPF